MRDLFFDSVLAERRATKSLLTSEELEDIKLQKEAVAALRARRRLLRQREKETKALEDALALLDAKDAMIASMGIHGWRFRHLGYEVTVSKKEYSLKWN